jgi:hypothetical protein
MIVHYSFFNPFHADRNITFDEKSKNVGEKTIWYTAPGKVLGMDGKFILTIFNDGEFKPRLEFYHKHRGLVSIMNGMHASIE